MSLVIDSGMELKLPLRPVDVVSAAPAATDASIQEAPKQFSSFPHFFDLPAELRTQILEYLVHHPTGIDIGGNGCAVRPSHAAKRHSKYGPRIRIRRGDGPGSIQATVATPAYAPRPDLTDHNLPEDVFPTSFTPRKSSVAPLSLFLANSQLYVEAEALFYSCNAFHADLTGGDSSGNDRDTSWRSAIAQIRPSWTPFCVPRSDDGDSGSESDEFEGIRQRPRRRSQRQRRNHQRLLAEGRHGCRNLMASPSRFKIRHLVLEVRRLGGVLENKVAPAMQELILRGSLRRLEVRFFTNGRPSLLLRFPQVVLAEKPLVRNAALLALLRLLADPDLEASRVTVLEGSHWTAWCQFHRPQDESGTNGDRIGGGGKASAVTGDADIQVSDAAGISAPNGSSSSKATNACKLKGDAQGWIDLDLKAMIRQFGGDQAHWWNI